VIGRYLILAEDEQGRILRAFSWTGWLEEGFSRARQECAKRGYFNPRLWADPVANH
jgi:hypothetical protein